jgi:hypothetical protein
VRACIEILDHQLEDAEALLEGAAACAEETIEKALVLHVKAVLAMQSGRKRNALRFALDALYLDPDPGMWALFLVVADHTERHDIVDATLKALAEANFFRSEELRRTLASDPRLDRIRTYEAYRLVAGPRLVKPACN